MKNLTLFILTITAFSVYGQDKETSTAEFKRFQIGVNISPDICYRTLKDFAHNAEGKSGVEYGNLNEIVKLSYTTGLNICFNFNKYAGIETGVQYSNKGFQSKIYGNNPTQTNPTLQYITNYHYIDIPLKANFIFGKRKVRFITSIGVVTNFFIKQTETVIEVYPDRTERRTYRQNYYNGIDFNRKVNISPTISIGIDYKINNRMNLRIEPTFRYGIYKMTKQPTATYLYNGGLNISYYFGL